MDYYEVLGVPADADSDTIRRAFCCLARKYHPDAGSRSSVEKFRQVREAYHTLREASRRLEYDRQLRRLSAPLVTDSHAVGMLIPWLFAQFLSLVVLSLSPWSPGRRSSPSSSQ